MCNKQYMQKSTDGAENFSSAIAVDHYNATVQLRRPIKVVFGTKPVQNSESLCVSISALGERWYQLFGADGTSKKVAVM